MPKYMTKQRKTLLDFLERHADEELSAKKIEAELADSGVSISAVYRNLSELEKEGKVRRISKSGSREVFYLYTDTHECRESLHLSCKKCGKTYHMNSQCADMLINNLAQNDKFTIDKSDTVLYGICKACKKNGE